jgi:hypothetical protein
VPPILQPHFDEIVHVLEIGIVGGSRVVVEPGFLSGKVGAGGLGLEACPAAASSPGTVGSNSKPIPVLAPLPGIG